VNDLFRRHGSPSRAAIHRNQIFSEKPILDAKEAHGIGMTRGYTLLLQKLPHCLQRGGVAALFLLFAALAFSPSAHAQSASSWNNRGQKAELREDYDAAYEDYLHAHQKKPSDMRYQERTDRMRFQAAAAHVDRGRVLRQSGDIAGALNQFTRALQIDPGNEAAAQEIQITQRQDQAPIASASPQGVTEASSILHDIASVTAPLELKPVSNDPITLHMVEDSKNIYMAIGKAAGLNVLFDPDYVPKRIPVDLTNVSLDDALRIVGLLSGTFYKPVTADTIFVAQNSKTKHTDLDDLAVQTFYLTNPSQASDANEIYTALRNVLPQDVKSYLVPSQDAIIVRGTPDDLVLAEKLINDLDRTHAEVVVDVAILEVNRDKVRNLGISLPQSFGLTPQANNSTTAVATATTGTTSNSAFTLNTLANMNATNFAVTIGGGTLNALLTDSDTKVLQNPSIRASDGQTATMKIGSKIPVATGSFGGAPGIGGAAGAMGGYGVQTQFSYLDVGVNIDMTPTIHLDHEISLKLSVEVSTEAGQVNLEGVTEPIIGQRSDKTTIQLRDGEPCLLAGILSKQDNYSNSGTPGLSDIPLIKYLFGTVNKEIQQDEVVFILIPHIVRESVLTRLNTRAIDTGTSNDYELRRAPAGELVSDAAEPSGPVPAPAQTTSAANAASAMVQQMKQQAMPPMPPGVKITAATAATAAVTGPPVSLAVLPLNSTHAVGSTFQVSILLSNAHDIFSVPLELQFDPKVLQLVNVDAGGLLGGDGQPVALVHRDEGNGLVAISASRPPGVSGVNGVNGQGEVCTLTFKAIAAGDSNLALVKVGAKNSLQASLPAVGSQAVVHVK
jgi:general secretion pathway protein D